MKKCPYCGHKFGFLPFVFLYGSDSMVKHRAGEHHRAHLCLKCHRKIWIYYNPFTFRHNLFLAAFFGLTLIGVITMRVFQPALELDPQKTLLCGIFLTLFVLSPVMAWVKYLSAEFKEEK